VLAVALALCSVVAGGLLWVMAERSLACRATGSHHCILRRMSGFYGVDLAHVHHTGFADHAEGAAPGLLAAFRRHGIARGTVVDLGCGGGQWLAALGRAGYDAVGIEVSPALARAARRTAPRAKVRTGSIYTQPLPPCDAVTALGEVLGYLPAGGARIPSFAAFFRRVAKALRPGGVFAFDLIVRNARAPLRSRNYRLGDDWAVMAESIEDPHRGRLVRDITTFRRAGATYRRSHEVHHVRVPSRDELVRALDEAGFSARTSRRWGTQPLAPRRLALIARKR
jgi:SAM-dependent methyltransferase